MKQNSKAPVRVAITGAAGQIGYQLAFRIASGQLFGPDQPVILQLLEITPALGALNGVAMELDDCAFETLDSVVVTDKAEVAFKDIHYGAAGGRAAARPRHGAQGSAARERADLLGAGQGARRRSPSRNVKILVVGNPANTNALIARENAKGLDPRNFTAMTRLDHNRARAQLADKAGAQLIDVRGVIDLGQPLGDAVPGPRARDGRRRARAVARAAGLVPRRVHSDRAAARRGDHQGARRVVGRIGGIGRDRSRARLGARHDRRRLGQHGRRVRRQLRHTPKASSTRIRSRCARGEYQIVQGLAIDDFARGKLAATDKELREERAGVTDLI